MSKYIQYIIFYLSLSFSIPALYPQILFAQDCGQQCYPYQFCPPINGQTQLFCASCPNKFAVNNGLSVFKPGLPNCYTIYNEFGGTPVVTTGKDYDFTAFEAGSSDQNIANATDWALSQYAGLCPNNPKSDCCVDIFLTIDPKHFTDAHLSPVKASGLTIQKIGNNCTQVCVPIPKIFLNFTDDFLTEGTHDAAYTQTLWNDEEWEAPRQPPYSNISDANADNVKLWSLSDVIMHELGHFLGYADEARIAEDPIVKGCALDGFLQYTAPPNRPRVGLTDMEKCWFKQLYCPVSDCINFSDVCSNLSAPLSQHTDDPFTFISIIPNPTSYHTVITYLLGRPSHVHIELFDILGKAVRLSSNELRTAGVSTLELNLDGLTDGSYYARIIVDGTPHTFKIIKSN